MNNLLKENEEIFHDNWADSEELDSLDVDSMFQACTSPELRYISSKLGSLNGKRLLDLGCGLGEGGVYFAKQGALVVCSDLSSHMLDFAQRVGLKNDISLRTLKASAESIGGILATERFDIIYAGNLFHHVDIKKTLNSLTPLMKNDGILVSWDPLRYNPIINIYRWLASEVRTEDEMPLGKKELDLFADYFEDVSHEFFWFTTLAIFILMFLMERKNPNKVRYWKEVVKESEKWEKYYYPLEKLDRLLLKLFPFLRYFCWNVVVCATKPKRKNTL